MGPKSVVVSDRGTQAQYMDSTSLSKSYITNLSNYVAHPSSKPHSYFSHHPIPFAYVLPHIIVRMGSSDEPMPVCIVGLGCRLPGGSSSGEKFWELLMNKKSARSETPSDRWNVDSFYHPNGEKSGSVCVLH